MIHYRLPLSAVALGVLLAVVAGLYWPGVDGPFVLDDRPNIVKPASVHIDELSLAELARSTESPGECRGRPFCRPLARVTFALNHYLLGEGPWGFKLVNIVIHLIATIGVFLVARHLVAALVAPRDGYESADPEGRGRIDARAYLVTALWALHPLLVSTVLYPVQRMTTLAAVAVFFGVWAYCKGRQRMVRGEPGGLRWALGGLVGGTGIGVLSKENAALLPALLLVLEAGLWRLRFHADVSKRSRGLLLAGLVLPTLFVVAYLALEVIQHPEGRSTRPFTLVERLWTEGRALFFYLRLLLLPDPNVMGLFHGDFGVSRGWLQPPSTLAAAVGVAGVAVFTGWALWRRRFVALGLGMGWFLVGHLLESTVIPLELVFEHRNYLPGVGIAFAAGYSLSHPALLARLRRGIRLGLAAALVAAVALPLQDRAQAWSSLPSFFWRQVQNHPEAPRVWSSMGHAVAAREAFPLSMRLYRYGAEVAPAEVGHPLSILTNMANLGEAPPEALLGEIEGLLARHPLSAFGVTAVIIVARHAGIPPTTRLRILKAATANPDWNSARGRAVAFWHLGRLRKKTGDLAGAAAAWEQALAIDPQARVPRQALEELDAEQPELEGAAASQEATGAVGGGE